MPLISNVRPHKVNQRRNRTPIELHLGAGALGLILGLLAGFVVAIASAAIQVLTQIPFAGWVFGTGIGTALACAAYPRLAFILFPATASFAAGYIAASVDPEHQSQIEPDWTTPTWVRMVFHIGVIAALAAVLLPPVLGWLGAA